MQALSFEDPFTDQGEVVHNVPPLRQPRSLLPRHASHRGDERDKTVAMATVERVFVLLLQRARLRLLRFVPGRFPSPCGWRQSFHAAEPAGRHAAVGGFVSAGRWGASC